MHVLLTHVLSIDEQVLLIDGFHFAAALLDEALLQQCLGTRMGQEDSEVTTDLKHTVHTIDMVP